jgi:hypothetical protein
MRATARVAPTSQPDLATPDSNVCYILAQRRYTIHSASQSLSNSTGGDLLLLTSHAEQFFKLQLKWAADNFDAEHRMRLAAEERRNKWGDLATLTQESLSREWFSTRICITLNDHGRLPLKCNMHWRFQHDSHTICTGGRTFKLHDRLASDLAALIAPRPLCMIHDKHNPIFPSSATVMQVSHLHALIRHDAARARLAE